MNKLINKEWNTIDKIKIIIIIIIVIIVIIVIIIVIIIKIKIKIKTIIIIILILILIHINNSINTNLNESLHDNIEAFKKKNNYCSISAEENEMLTSNIMKIKRYWIICPMKKKKLNKLILPNVFVTAINVFGMALVAFFKVKKKNYEKGKKVISVK